MTGVHAESHFEQLFPVSTGFSGRDKIADTENAKNDPSVETYHREPLSSCLLRILPSKETNFVKPTMRSRPNHPFAHFMKQTRGTLRHNYGHMLLLVNEIGPMEMRSF